jgi:hypothetical protein
MGKRASFSETSTGPKQAAETAPTEAANTVARDEKKAAHIELVAAIVLSVAAVATAWSAYQSTRWSGEMASSYNEAGAFRTESVRATNQATQQINVAVTLSADWATAELTGDRELADVLRVRMPAPLAEAMNRWLGDWQPGQPLPPGDPFNEGGYASPETIRAAELERQAEATFHEGRNANQHSDNYVLTGVVFALALFFAGMSSRFNHQGHGLRIVYGAACLLAVGLVLLLVEPKNVSI